jgi:hypothetical protein
MGSKQHLSKTDIQSEAGQFCSLFAAPTAQFERAPPDNLAFDRRSFPKTLILNAGAQRAGLETCRTELPVNSLLLSQLANGLGRQFSICPVSWSKGILVAWGRFELPTSRL